MGVKCPNTRRNSTLGHGGQLTPNIGLAPSNVTRNMKHRHIGAKKKCSVAFKIRQSVFPSEASPDPARGVQNVTGLGEPQYLLVGWGRDTTPHIPPLATPFRGHCPSNIFSRPAPAQHWHRQPVNWSMSDYRESRTTSRTWAGLGRNVFQFVDDVVVEWVRQSLRESSKSGVFRRRCDVLTVLSQ